MTGFGGAGAGAGTGATGSEKDNKKKNHDDDLMINYRELWIPKRVLRDGTFKQKAMKNQWG